MYIPLKKYFCNDRLVTKLCQKRVDLSRVNRRDQLISKISGYHEKKRRHELLEMMPPRNHWLRPTRKERLNSKHLPTTVTMALKRQVLREISRPNLRYAWAENLKSFLDDCRERALTWKPTDTYAPERIYATPKNQPGDGQKYRVLAPYSFSDNLIGSAFAAYLRDLIDPALGPTKPEAGAWCYAFRSSQYGKPLNHHDAVAKLRDFTRSVGSNEPLWVAECDIQGFYDSVSQDVALQSLERIFTQIDVLPDSRLKSFLHSFMEGYNYPEAREQARIRLEKDNISQPILYDPIKILQEERLSVNAGKLGIPQGSAISCVLANVILLTADKACLKHLKEHNHSYYARYCDDIIIASTSRRVCDSALNAYCQTLKEDLKLPCHVPKEVQSAKIKTFWSMKSKKPYRWMNGASGNADTIPWVGFLGYQLKRDGTIRIRNSSIQKEIAKQRKVADEIIGGVAKAVHKKQKNGQRHEIDKLKNIEYSLLMHLVAIGVGYNAEHSTEPRNDSVCWSKGFYLLNNGPTDLSSLKELDRQRNLVMKKIRGKLRSLERSCQIDFKNFSNQDIKGEENVSKKKKKPFRLKYAGRPFSYYSQFAQ